MTELIYKVANQAAPDIRKEIPQRLADIVALAMARRFENRYQDGDHLAADLR